MEDSKFTSRHGSGGRCKALIYWNNGGVVRCSAQCYYDADDFCYRHQKVFDGLSTPAPRDMWEPGANGRGGRDEYVEKIASMDGKNVKVFR